MARLDVDLLETGIYSVSEATRLLRLQKLDASQQRVRGWIAGYYRTAGEPIIRNQVGFYDRRLAMSFTNLMEARFIAYFSGKGVSVNHIRAIVEEARDFANHEHPFATKLMFTTDGKNIFGLVAEKTGDPRMYDFQKKNWAMYVVMAQSLRAGVIYDLEGEALAWHPHKHLAPHVIVHPKRAFGQPVLKDSGVPTATLYDSFKADDENHETVANWFGIPVAQVKEAVRFEGLLAQAG